MVSPETDRDSVSVIHGARSPCMSCVLDCEVKCICGICYCGAED